MRLFRNRIVSLVLFGATLAAFPAAANDSTAVLGAGGLELTTTNDIVMANEDLFLSPKEVRVRYVFRNESDHDITTRVAFPLPEVPFGPRDNVYLPDDAKDNFVDFSVTSDGKTLKPELDQRAISAPTEVDGQKPTQFPTGKDMTQAVREAGLPINANLPAWKEKLRALPSDVRKQLVKKGVLLDESGDGEIDDLSPQWSLKATYHWQQIFPAGKAVVVEHRYRPVVGQSFVSPEDGIKTDLEEIQSEYKKTYCLDQAGMDGVKRLLSKAASKGKAKDDNFLFAYETSYVLTTGTNWKGRIGQFRMAIDKVDKDAVLSTCVDGIKKTGPTTFEVQRSDFTPTKNVHFIVFSLGDN